MFTYSVVRMCIQALSSCVPPSLLEGRPLKTTVITLVALSVLSLLMGTLSALSLQGTLQTTLAAVGWNGAAGFVGGGSLLLILGYCLHASGKAERQVSLSTKQKALLESSSIFRIGEEKQRPERATCQALYEHGDREETKIVWIHFRDIPQYVFLWYRKPLDSALHTWHQAEELFKNHRFTHYVAPLSVIELEVTVEVVGTERKREIAVLDRSKYPCHPETQEDLYLHYITMHEARYRTYFGHVLRLICQEGLHVTSLKRCFPLTEKGKIILLRLDKSSDLQTSLQNFFDAMPSKWHGDFKQIVKEVDRRSFVKSITSDASKKREERHQQFHQFLREKGIRNVTDPIEDVGEHQGLVATLNQALAQRTQRTLIYGRKVEFPLGNDRKTFLRKCGELAKAGVIYAYKEYLEVQRVIIWC